MKISFNLNVDDWVAFQQYHREKKSPFSKWLVPIILMCMAWIALLNVYLVYMKVEESPMRTWISIIVFFVFAYLLYLRKHSLKRVKEVGLEMEKKHPEAFGPMTMEFDEKGIEVQSGQTSKSITWNEMHRYDKNRKYYFLYSKKGVVYIIPKRGIEENDTDFEVMLNKYLSKD